MNGNNKAVELIQKFNAHVLKTDEAIRKLSIYKTKSNLDSQNVKELELLIERDIKNLDNILREQKVLQMNINLVNRFMDLHNLWQFYKMNQPIESREKEEMMAEGKINEIMGEYNREHYGRKS